MTFLLMLLTTLAIYFVIGFFVMVVARVLDRRFPDLMLGVDTVSDSGERFMHYALWPLIVGGGVWIILTDKNGPYLLGRVEDFFVNLLAPKKEEK